ncbi:hypothetical protein G7062_11125 [Erysipelothrix sp. HDW6C]|uniref:hypothetical protein n=1 Tax=Erysipelothrix sp. HDW6C TaxID=2714930 RepID=UPI00140834D1|nr:hypothetical protein [Erysipelothrix sp. HDW6C]QIK70812.1 hypothetical protein G7062_11125 [Erysipelothrix sp. HDW6C]
MKLFKRKKSHPEIIQPSGKQIVDSKEIDAEITKLQRYIYKRPQNQDTDAVIAHINKVRHVIEFTDEVWWKVMYPACTHPDATLLQWMFVQGATYQDSLTKAVLSSQIRAFEVIKQEIAVIEVILKHVSGHERQDFLDRILNNACWYGVLYAVEYLLSQGADLMWISDNGKTPLDNARIYGERFEDPLLYDLLIAYQERKLKKLGTKKYYTEIDWAGNHCYKRPN